ncbi:MAG: hypothetical protein ABJH98_18055 [Reichenbachiella sp.]|uniref:hypothetical protein n=1 Tax=Reichenbachiella sp. TaxID=2184521 RepID=UPI003299633D
MKATESFKYLMAMKLPCAIEHNEVYGLYQCVFTNCLHDYTSEDKAHFLEVCEALKSGVLGYEVLKELEQLEVS